MKVNNYFRLGQVLVLVCLILVGCNSQESSSESNDKESNQAFSDAFATGSAGGLYNVLGGGMTKVINENSDYIRLNATTPSSVSQTPQMLHDGQAAFGIGMADMMARARAGEEEFTSQLDKLQTVLAMYDNVMSAVVLKDSTITNINEVIGLKVGVPSESTKNAVATFFEEAGVPESEVNWQYLSYNEQAEALKDNNIDVGIFTAFPKNGLLEELASTRGIRFLAVDQEVRDSFDQKYPLWSTNLIPKGVYPGVEEDNYFYTVYSVLYTHQGVPEDVVYDVSKHILENNSDISDIHPAGENITLSKSQEYIERHILDPANLHPGAKKYLEEQGILP